MKKVNDEQVKKDINNFCTMHELQFLCSVFYGGEKNKLIGLLELINDYLRNNGIEKWDYDIVILRSPNHQISITKKKPSDYQNPHIKKIQMTKSMDDFLFSQPIGIFRTSVYDQDRMEIFAIRLIYDEMPNRSELSKYLEESIFVHELETLIIDDTTSSSLKKAASSYSSSSLKKTASSSSSPIR